MTNSLATAPEYIQKPVFDSKAPRLRHKIFNPKRSKRKASNLRLMYITSLFRSCKQNLEVETGVTSLRPLSNSREIIQLWSLCYPLVRYLSQCYVARGKDDYVSKSKTLRAWFFQFASRSPVLIPVKGVVSTRGAIPKPLYSIVRRYLVDKDPRIITWVLNILICSRDLNGEGELNDEQIDTIAIVNDASASYFSKKTLRRQLRASARKYVSPRYNNRLANNDKLAVSSFENYKSGPNSQKVKVTTRVCLWPPQDETSSVRLNALECAELDAYALKLNPEVYSIWRDWCILTDQSILLSFFDEFCPSEPPESIKALVLCRFGAKADIELKNRIYAIINFWINASLEGLHRLGYSILEDIPINYFRSHNDAFRKLVKLQNSGQKWLCFADESQASDNFCLESYKDVMAEWLPPSTCNAWYKLIKALPFSYNDRIITYGSGSQMGSKGSWPWWNITECCVDTIKSASTIMVRVGDDTGQPLKDARWQIPFRERDFGCVYNSYKGLVSKVGVEMCKQYYLHGCVVTPVPMQLRFAARRDVGAFGCYLQRLADVSQENLFLCLPKILKYYSMKKRTVGVSFSSKKLNEYTYMAFLVLFPYDPYVLKVRKLAALKCLLAELKECTKWVPKKEKRTLSNAFYEANRSNTVKRIRAHLLKYLDFADNLVDEESAIRFLRACPRLFDRAEPQEVMTRFNRLSLRVCADDNELGARLSEVQEEIIDVVGYTG